MKKIKKVENNHCITTWNRLLDINNKFSLLEELSCPEENEVLPNYTDATWHMVMTSQDIYLIQGMNCKGNKDPREAQIKK